MIVSLYSMGHSVADVGQLQKYWQKKRKETMYIQRRWLYS